MHTLGPTYRDLGLGKRQARHCAHIAYATYVGLLRSRLIDGSYTGKTSCVSCVSC